MLKNSNPLFKKIFRHHHIHHVIIKKNGNRHRPQLEPPLKLNVNASANANSNANSNSNANETTTNDATNTVNPNAKIFIYFAILFVSETLPFLEAESNGILHLTSNCLKKAIGSSSS